MNKKFGASPIRTRDNVSQEGAGSGYYMNNPCNDVFTCAVCGYEIHPEGAGSDHRNHCPRCLSSIHLDNIPGDRASDCHGIMDPIAVWVRDNGEWALIHRCRSCGALSSNRIAADDNPAKLMAIANKAADNPPFPVDRLKDMCKALGYDPDEEY
ncbi:MAG: RNHCP domain-containing protein [Lachnospiraceae bacterium]|nr:RNHCP domain-containing protein [Lachnospiraceae bacterium]